MYEDKHSWSEAYLKGYFFRGIRSTQRCEGFNGYLNQYVNRKQQLTDFVDQMARSMGRQREMESYDDYQSSNGKLSLTTHLREYEQQAGIYDYSGARMAETSCLWCLIVKVLADQLPLHEINHTFNNLVKAYVAICGHSSSGLVNLISLSVVKRSRPATRSTISFLFHVEASRALSRYLPLCWIWIAHVSNFSDAADV
ncbi:hypothetical protein WN944_019109 [Citrus x changshan-huyou]|uniref:Protein FAR1-RELATED SEQUENCE n=1 Tax=Citrus x changshan-huyou TaxID=2935761 RepID=A0AAP0LVL0_9ROSI